MDQPLKLQFIGKPGILSSELDPRTLNLDNYLNVNEISEVPRVFDWTLKKKTPWLAMGNMKLSDCTCAAAGHMIECWTANAGRENIIDNKSVLHAYSSITGYDPVTGKNDTGAVCLKVLKYWKNKGVGDHKIEAFATIAHKRHELIKAAIYMFGGIYTSLSLPNTIKGQEIWDVVPGPLTGDSAPDSFGGHAVPILAFDETYLTCISWGKEKKITWAFWDAYCNEVFAVITSDFLKDNKTPLGMNISALQSDLLGLTGEKESFIAELSTINQSKSIHTMKHEDKEGVAGRVSSAKGDEAIHHEDGTSGSSSQAKGNEAGATHHKDGTPGGSAQAKGNEAGRVSSAAGNDAGRVSSADGEEEKPHTPHEKSPAHHDEKAGSASRGAGAAGNDAGRVSS